MNFIKKWTDYNTALRELSGAADVWLTAEKTADEALRVATEAADAEQVRARAELARRKAELQVHIDESREHLQGVALDDLLPRRLPARKSTTPASLAQPDELKVEIQRLSRKLYGERRDAEQRRINGEVEARRRREAEAAGAEKLALLKRRWLIVGSLIVGYVLISLMSM
jgi:hypothetical protein